MPRVTIDNREIDLPADATLLDAARKLDIDIPALCWHAACEPSTSCMTCIIKIISRRQGPQRFVPACATRAEDGMIVQSETDEVHQVRRTALELLLSDHVGECRAPCQYACPFHTDIPQLMRAIAAGQIDEAIATLRTSVPLAAVFSRWTPQPCERACRRRAIDRPAAIPLLMQYVADKDLTSAAPYLPHCQPDSGQRVALVGAGPAGLAAAYFLRQHGHECTLFEQSGHAGGSLRDVPRETLPPDVLAGELALLEQLGFRFELGAAVGQRPTLSDLRHDFDAVLLTVGRLPAEVRDLMGLPVAGGHLPVDAATHETELQGVFAAGDLIRLRRSPLHAAADGKAAAICIDQHLRGATITGSSRLPILHTARPDIAAETRADQAPPPAGELTDVEARAEAERCLHCDCHKLETCRLRRYAEAYNADARRFRGQRRTDERRALHPEILFEPGKCILCGLCVQISEQADEPLGLTFVGRGFDMRVAVPFDEPLSAALKVAARRCVEVCPTGALALRDEQPGAEVM